MRCGQLTKVGNRTAFQNWTIKWGLGLRKKEVLLSGLGKKVKLGSLQGELDAITWSHGQEGEVGKIFMGTYGVPETVWCFTDLILFQRQLGSSLLLESGFIPGLDAARLQKPHARPEHHLPPTFITCLFKSPSGFQVLREDTAPTASLCSPQGPACLRYSVYICQLISVSWFMQQLL